MTRMLYLKDGKETAKRTCVCECFDSSQRPSWKKIETFLVSNLCHIEGFCVTTVRLVMLRKER